MNRSAKRHRSTKVPNVKLRPASASISKRNERRQQEAEAEQEDLAHYRRLREAHRTGKGRAHESNDAEDDDDDDEEANDGDDDMPPLLGCVICMTGIVEEKGKLTEYATMLGAQVQGNLTEDATHLIALEPGSEKYRCAVRLGLPILRPEWLKELRTRWTEAIDYSFDGLMEEHRLDTFENVVAALAGITEPTERTGIRKKLKSGSATTPTTFVLDGSFTHLICGDIKTSQTMEVVIKYRQRAERFLRRGESLPDEGDHNATQMKAVVRLRAVWKEWVDDCLEVQGCIDEKFYSVDEAKPTIAQRKEIKDSILREKSRQEKANKERMTLAKQKKGVDNGNRASTQVKETPVNGNSDVQRIVKKPKIDIGQYVQQISRGDKREVTVQSEAATGKENGTWSNMSKAHSFTEHVEAPHLSRKASIAKPLSPLDSNEVTKEAPEEQRIDSQRTEEEEAMLLEEDPASGLVSDIREKSLSSLSFRIDLRDEDRNRAARKALESQGVINVLEVEDPRPAHFHILPLGKVDLPVNSNPSNVQLGVPVTHLFIERCLFESRIVSLAESFALQPAVITFPMKASEKVFVGLTGFAAEDDVDRKQVEIALRAAGIESSSTLKRGHHTHLLVGKEAANSKSSQIKIQRAKEWGIHCVDFEFVNNIFRRGIIEPAVTKMDKVHRSLLEDRSMIRGASMGATIGETQRLESQGSPFLPIENRPMSMIKQTSKASRPWQRSASGSQALLNGEESRGVVVRSPLSLHHNVDSLEAGSLAIKTSAEEVMALLGNRSLGDTSHDSSIYSSSSSAKKRGRLPPSRLRERRADSVMGDQPSAEELLAKRQQEEERLSDQLLGQTQMSLGTQREESMRITYDDPISRRERRKIGDLIATSVKNKAQQDEAESGSSSSTEVEEESIHLRTTSTSSSVSPSKRRSLMKAAFSPSIQARRQPGTCNRNQ